MRIVVDTNIVFSAVLNSDNKISRIILQPRTALNFYSTEILLEEIYEHKDKLLEISKMDSESLFKSIRYITKRIKFIDLQLIPAQTYLKAERLTRDVDIDDTEFVALTEHIKGGLWTGDKQLRNGLKIKGWNKFVTTTELYDKIRRRNK